MGCNCVEACGPEPARRSGSCAGAWKGQRLCNVLSTTCVAAMKLNNAHQLYWCQPQQPLHCSPHFLLNRSRSTTVQGKTFGISGVAALVMPVRGCVSMPTDNLHDSLGTDSRWVAVKGPGVAAQVSHLPGGPARCLQ